MTKTDSEAVVIDTDDLRVLVKLSVLEAFSDDTTLDKLKSYMSSLLQPFKDALVKANSEIDCLKADVVDKGRIIQKISVDIEELERTYDDHEQHGSKGSVWIFGVPENIHWDTDPKVIHVLNEDGSSNLRRGHPSGGLAFSDLRPDRPASPSSPSCLTLAGCWSSHCLSPAFW